MQTRPAVFFKELIRVFASLVFIHAILIPATAQEFLFKYYTRNNGLPSDYVTSMYFDRSGAFWVGTDKGICRFSGETAKTLTIDDGLANNMVYAILEDNKGAIWLGGYESGLTKLRIVAGKPVVEKLVSRPFSVLQLLQDTAGYYWIKSGYIQKDYSYKIWRTKNLEGDWQLVANLKNHRDADFDLNGHLYYITGKNILWTALYAGKIAIASLEGEDSSSVSASGTKAVFFSNKRTLLVYGKETSLMTKNSKPFILGNYGKYLSMGTSDILYRSANGSHLFKNQQYYAMIDNNTNPADHPFLATAVVDKFGQLYFSHFGKGIMQWRMPYVTQYDMPAKTGRIVKTQHGILCNAGHQLYTYNNLEQTMRKIPSVIPDVSFISVDKNGSPVVCNGNSFLTTTGKPWIKGSTDFSDLSDLVYAGGSYYASSYSFSIHKFSEGAFDTAWQRRLHLPTRGIERLQTYDTMLYAYTLSWGLIEIQLSNLHSRTLNKSNGLVSNSVFTIYKEKDSLWVGTNAGLSQIFPGGYRKWEAQDGFSGNRVVCIFRDRCKRLWVLSDTYLHLFAGQKLYPTRSFPVLVDESSYINTGIYDDRTDLLWIGTNKKLLKVQMNAVEPDARSYPMELGSIEADKKQVVLTDNRKLELNANTENVTVYFSHPHYSQYSKPLSYVRLLGYNEEWQPLNAAQVISFQKLPPGTYKLQTRTEGPDFGQSFNENQYLITILRPWYLQTKSIILFSCLLFTIAFLLSRGFARRRYDARLKQLQAEQAIEMERLRISRELHDNVGSMLTVVINRLEDAPILNTTEQINITAIARDTLGQLRDAIWTLDKSKLNMGQWKSRIREFLRHIETSDMSIKCDLNFPDEPILTPGKALNSFRIIQEACANAINHSGGTCLQVSGRIDAGVGYELIITDNGKGFDRNRIRPGHGLRNMEKRAAELGGEISVNSKPGIGTTVCIYWPV